MMASTRPFSVPPSAELFWLTNPALLKLEEDEGHLSVGHGARELRVWEKTTAAARNGATKKVRNEDVPMAPLDEEQKRALKVHRSRSLEAEKPDQFFLTNVATKPSIGLLDPLQEKGSDLRGYIKKKRDMFLVQMALDVKRSEIVRLDEKARAREEALTKSQAMLDEDKRAFDSFFQQQHSEAQQKKMEAEGHAKRRQQKAAEIKRLAEQIAGVQSDIAKRKEEREECSGYKEFLDKLTPKEWQDEQLEIKARRKERRREAWISQQMRSINERLAREERLMEQRAAGGAEAEEPKRGRRQKKTQAQEEEQKAQQEQRRQAQRRKFQRLRQEEEKRVAADFQSVSSEEELELYFKEPQQLMDSFTELEEKNLFLIQSSQETEKMLDELQSTFKGTERDMETKVRQLKEQMKQLDQSIEAEKRKCNELRLSFEHKAGTQLQDHKLGWLNEKVQELFVVIPGMSSEHNPDTHAMLVAVEKRLEELINNFDELYHQDDELIVKLEKDKDRERRDLRKRKQSLEQAEKDESRKQTSLKRTQQPIFKKAGKQVMYRSPPLRQERRVVKDTSEDEANAHDHKVFGLYIDRKTQLPQPDLPEPEDPKQTRTRPVVAQAAEPSG